MHGSGCNAQRPYRSALHRRQWLPISTQYCQLFIAPGTSQPLAAHGLRQLIEPVRRTAMPSQMPAALGQLQADAIACLQLFVQPLGKIRLYAANLLLINA